MWLQSMFEAGENVASLITVGIGTQQRQRINESSPALVLVRFTRTCAHRAQCCRRLIGAHEFTQNTLAHRWAWLN